MSINRRLRLTLAWLPLSLGACGSPPQTYQEVSVSDDVMAAYLKDKPTALHPHYERLYKDGRRNQVLNSMEIGIMHLERSEFELAGLVLDEAIGVIESFYVDDEAAEIARTSSFSDEAIKDFKGEPYERVMLYYYRGLAYLGEHKLQNARACFRAAAQHDAVAEEEQNRCDFASMYFLQGVVAQWVGDKNRESIAFNEVGRQRPAVPLPTAAPATLVLIETGAAPVKIVDGIDGERLTFHRNRKTKAVSARLVADSGNLVATPIEDIYWQSATRGGRAIDYFLEGKAYFKKEVAAKSQVGVEIGATIQGAAQAIDTVVEFESMASGMDTMGGSGSLGEIGAAIGVASSLRSMLAGQVRARADDRHCRNLPEAIHVLTSDELLLEDRVRIEFLDGDGSVLSLPAHPVVSIPLPDGRQILWSRSKSTRLQPVSNR